MGKYSLVEPRILILYDNIEEKCVATGDLSYL